MQDNNDVPVDGLDDWDPLSEEYNSAFFNCYTSGPGANLPLQSLPPFTKGSTENKSKTLCVKNVPVRVTQTGLRHLFNNFGKVLSVRKLSPRPQYPKKTIAFVDYGTTAEALTAIQMLDDKPPFYLKVNIAMSRQERNKMEQKQQEEMDAIYKQIEQAKAAVDKACAASKEVGMGRGKLPRKVFTLKDLKDIKVTLGKGTGQRSVISSSSSSASYKTLEDSVTSSESSSGSERVCSVCRKNASQRCRVCYVIYCSRECQVKDWPQHYKECLKKLAQKNATKEESVLDTSGKNSDALSNHVPQLPQPKSVQNEVQSVRKPPPKQQPQKTTPELQKVQTLDEETLGPGEKAEVVLCHGSDADSFYLQLMSSYTALAEMQVRLQSLCVQNADYEPKKGEVCAAVYSGEWYRAAVRQILKAGEGCHVYFLDYGNESTVALADMCPLPLKCRELKTQALHCTLHGVPANSLDKKKIYEELIGFSSATPVLVAQMVKMSHDDKYEVELFSKEGESFSALLRSKGLLSVVTLHKPQTRIPRMPSVLEQCTEGGNLMLQVMVQGGDCVWCTAPDEEMQTIERELSATCPTIVQGARKSFAVGEYVASQSIEDGCWYRACIVRSSPTEQWVRYLDYGNEEVNTAVVPLGPEQKRLAACTVRLSGPPIAKLKTEDIIVAKVTSVVEGDIIADIVKEGDPTVRGICKLAPWHFGVECFKDDLDEQTKGAVGNEECSSSTPPAALFNAKDLVPKVIHIPVRSIPEKKCNMRFSCKTPDVLFLHQESLMEAMADMEVKLHEWAKKSDSSRHHYEIGEYVAAESKAMKAWHRGKVMSGKNADETYLVLLIDSGNSERIPPSSLRSLPPQFADYAMFAHCVTLDGGVSPQDSRLEKMLNREPFAAVQVGSRNGVPVVKLVRKNGTCINDILKEASQDPVAARSPQPSLSSIAPCPVPEESFGAVITSTDGRLFYVQPLSQRMRLMKVVTGLLVPPTEHLETCSPNGFAAVYSPKEKRWDRARIVSLLDGGKNAKVFYVDYGKSKIVDRGSLRVLPPAMFCEPACALAVKLDKVPPLDLEEVAPLLNEKVKIEVVGSNSGVLKVRMVTPDDVCINDILASPGEPVARACIPEATMPAGRSEMAFMGRVGNVVYLHPTANINLLETLLTEVNGCVPGTLSGTVSEGDAVCAKAPGEKLWHRGTVQGPGTSGTLRVLLVDAGRVVEIPEKELRHLSSRLASHPALTIGVRLHGLPDLTDAMLEPLEERTIFAEVVKGGSPPVAKLYDEAGRRVLGPPLSGDAAAVRDIPEHQLPDGRVEVSIIAASSSPPVLMVLQQTLQDELRTMTALLNDTVSTLPPAENVVQSSYVCAKYYDLWYRAQVTAVGAFGLVVHFVDFGNKEEVSAGDVKQLPDRFLAIPAFLNRVTVAGIDKIAEQYCQQIRGLTVHIEVIDRRTSPPSVNIYDEAGTILNSEFST